MSLANKFGIPESLLDAAKKALEEANEYQKKVQAHMAKKGIKSLNDLTADQKKKFFNDLDAMHTAKNEEVEQIDEAIPKSTMYAVVHSKTKKIVEKGNKADMAKKVKDMNSKEAGSHFLGNSPSKKVGDTFGEEVELTQEDLDFIASLNQIDEISIKTAVKAHEKMALETNPEKNRTGSAGDQSDRLLKRMKAKWGDKTVKKAQNKYQGTNEDLNQIDELSKKTLGKYVKAAAQDAEEAGRDQEYHGHKNDYARGEKRQKGISKAVDRLTKEDVSLEDFTLEQIEEYMQTEEFAQLDELSKETLGNYIKKRQHDVAAQGAITRQHAVDAEKAKKENNYSQQRKSNERSDKAFAKGWNYRQNIGKAVDKIVKKA